MLLNNLVVIFFSGCTSLPIYFAGDSSPFVTWGVEYPY